jgi:hypothetical protein
MAIVYLHRKEYDNSIYYVGIGNKESRAYNKTDRNIHWKRVYKKYGLIVDIVAKDIDLNQAKEIEKFMINSLGVENLCNITLGGEGAFGLKHSEELKIKQTELLKSYSKGRVHTKETREKISNTRKEKNIKISEITRQRQKEAWKESAIRVREITSGIECYMWETEAIFGSKYRTINGNSNHDRPIKRGINKGLNFIRI